uniref:CCN family member 2-like isoform X2 n=1 Tax=Myxine glutinosa TaxID=7769 RepID=UPI00358E78F4
MDPIRAATLLLTAYTAAAQLCTTPCRCPAQLPRCPSGVQPVVDSCGCCKLCPRPLDMNQKGCNVHGILYENGRDFQIGCALCRCRQGSLLCVPGCPSNVRLPSADCPFPRRVRRPGLCCAFWVCDGAPLALPPARTAKAAAQAVHPAAIRALNGPALAAFRDEATLALAAARQPKRDQCMAHSTEWSACSRTCGLGLSTRVSNDNPRCRLERESQVCVVRPCQAPPERIRKLRRHCKTSYRSLWPVKLEVSGCKSVRAEHLRFCGGCGDGRCCTPFQTVTRSVEFRCPSGKMLKQKLMVIKSCACHSNCPDKDDMYHNQFAHKDSLL